MASKEGERREACSRAGRGADGWRSGTVEGGEAAGGGRGADGQGLLGSVSRERKASWAGAGELVQTG